MSLIKKNISKKMFLTDGPPPTPSQKEELPQLPIDRTEDVGIEPPSLKLIVSKPLSQPKPQSKSNSKSNSKEEELEEKKVQALKEKIEELELSESNLEKKIEEKCLHLEDLGSKSERLTERFQVIEKEIESYKKKRKREEEDYRRINQRFQRDFKDRHEKIKKLNFSLSCERNRLNKLFKEVELKTQESKQEKKILFLTKESLAKVHKEISSLEYDRWKIRREKYSLEDQIETLKKGKEELISDRVSLRELLRGEKEQLKSLNDEKKLTKVRLKKLRREWKRTSKNSRKKKSRFQQSKKQALEIFNQVQTRCFTMENKTKVNELRLRKLESLCSSFEAQKYKLVEDLESLEKKYHESAKKEEKLRNKISLAHRTYQKIQGSLLKDESKIKKLKKGMETRESRSSKKLRSHRLEIALLEEKGAALKKGVLDLEFQKKKEKDVLRTIKERQVLLLGESKSIEDSLSVQRQRLLESKKEHEKSVRDQALSEQRKLEEIENKIKAQKLDTLKEYEDLIEEKKQHLDRMILKETEKAQEIKYEAQSQRDALLKEMKEEAFREQQRIIEDGRKQTEKLEQIVHKEAEGKYRACILSLQKVISESTDFSPEKIDEIIEKALDTSPLKEEKTHIFSNSKSVRRFYMALSVAIFSFVFTLSFKMIFPKHYGVGLSYLEKILLDKDGKQGKEALKIMEEKRLAKLYIPSKDTQLKDTNWENVLYTKGFVFKWLENKDFEKNYVLELTDFFNFVLRIDDMSVIEVIREEKEHIRRIAENAKKVKLVDKDTFLAGLKSQEVEFRSKLVNILGDERALETYLRFKKRYQLELLNE